MFKHFHWPEMLGFINKSRMMRQEHSSTKYLVKKDDSRAHVREIRTAQIYKPNQKMAGSGKLSKLRTFISETQDFDS